MHPITLQSLEMESDMKSTQAMRDRIRELMRRGSEQDDYDRAVVCVLDDLESLISAPAQGEQVPSKAQIEAAWRAFENCPIDLVGDSDEEQKKCVIAAIKAALAAHPHEAPVAWRVKNDFGHWHITQDKALADTYRDTENKDVQPLYLAAQPPAAPVETEVRCYGCGSPMTASDLAKLKAEDPKVISCCPERKPLNIDDWMTRALEAERKLAAHSQPLAAPVSAGSARPHEAPEWLWYGEDESGLPIVTFGRWPKAGTKWRYKWADIQPTEHDHGRLQTPRQAFETIIESLRYDGNDIDSLTIGEIRRALP